MTGFDGPDMEIKQRRSMARGQRLPRSDHATLEGLIKGQLLDHLEGELVEYLGN